MIEEFHGKMHELSGGLMQLGKKLKVQEDRIEEIEKVSEEYDRNLKEQMSMNSHISACEQYIKKVSNQIEDISNTEDDIEKQKSQLEELKKIFLYILRERRTVTEKISL